MTIKEAILKVLEEQKSDNLKIHKVEYGKLPSLKELNFDNDIVFNWNGTTSGGSPSPRKLRVTSSEMACAVCNVPTTISGAKQFGMMW